ncbi:YkgJ family cysteine cluster protein [Desulfobacca acetoxidans]|uniref:YkgJ family cysteine cluster protein n=1 Tax=Desulfobacca acetoxidans (strain ATCC 700848 / DSM 11109 / ASRB2) TaxID=880072 RepID=F2NIA4_DESAR|nr:YkgJ family cysteine cluster protein [Desulfobacca acetoxidans]AEB09873.1 protein of unknown function UPF0153 [Desulfobacca acetoxidans DSM 11109]
MSADESQEIDVIELTPKTPFTFRCYPGVACFNECCARTTIFLSPYDVLRLRRRLNLSSGEFLQRFTHQIPDDASGLPSVVLTMTAGETRCCPFSSPNGCQVYEDRPTACRYYPVGVASQWTDQGLQECYVYFQEDHCRGFEAGDEWTIEKWQQDQGVLPYEEFNREWKSIVLRVGVRTGKSVSAKMRDEYYMALYDLDRFQRYVFDSDFLKIFAVDPEQLTRMQTDPEELLRFGYRYIKFMLRLENCLEIKKVRIAPD